MYEDKEKNNPDIVEDEGIEMEEHTQKLWILSTIISVASLVLSIGTLIINLYYS